MNKIVKLVGSVVLVAALLLGVSTLSLTDTQTVGASYNLGTGVESAAGDDVPESLTGGDGIFRTVANVLLFIIGGVSVIMLIYGGIRYTTSGGNANSVTTAKNTIMYAVIGLIIAILAYAIVNFVMGWFTDI